MARARDAGAEAGACSTETAAATAFGAFALTFMRTMYALEHRHPRFVLAFPAGCLLSNVYGFLARTWPFGLVELMWAGIATRRWREQAVGEK